ncbi:universal stress protein [Mangrovimonas sp. YM274]|uniref:universal stress protein n=1 Tax=Mangrovimonas sp. YM274 TaxID=3070660 RepID=UPI0027DBD470|nr:universal stress protein [Mangrovimonas sp. YM274]WMI68086.1 universal stress protein [Mangrovimonas sp. YM274]
MKNILLPTDFSENSLNSIRYAIKFYEGVSCEFFLLHVNVLRNGMANLSATELVTLQDETYRRLEQLRSNIEKELPKGHHFTFHTVVDHNFFVESVRSQVKKLKIDAIVIGTKGANTFENSGIGTRTHEIITKVKCNALVVPQQAKFHDCKEIIFPTDFSMIYNDDTLQSIGAILKRFNTNFRVLHVCKKGSELFPDQVKNKKYLEAFLSYFHHSFNFFNDKKLEAAIQSFVEDQGVDLIAMVAKNLNYMQRLLFQPSVKKLTYLTNIPFLVLHEHRPSK